MCYIELNLAEKALDILSNLPESPETSSLCIRARIKIGKTDSISLESLKSLSNPDIFKVLQDLNLQNPGVFEQFILELGRTLIKSIINTEDKQKLLK